MKTEGGYWSCWMQFCWILFCSSYLVFSNISILEPIASPKYIFEVIPILIIPTLNNTCLDC